jgi:peptidoglycan/xylan/chitin deacetylase (PgdA/CDA1 family)
LGRRPFAYQLAFENRLENHLRQRRRDLYGRAGQLQETYETAIALEEILDRQFFLDQPFHLEKAIFHLPVLLFPLDPHFYPHSFYDFPGAHLGTGHLWNLAALPYCRSDNAYCYHGALLALGGQGEQILDISFSLGYFEFIHFIFHAYPGGDKNPGPGLGDEIITMHNLNLKFIKIFIVIFAISAVVIMVSGMKMLKNNFYFNRKYLNLEWDSVKTQLAWRYENKNFPFSFSGSGNKIPVSQKQPSAQLVPVLLYHGVISDETWQPDGVNISTKDFQAQMFALKRDGWQTLREEDYLAFIQGKKPLPEKSFLLTFDDGRKDSFYGADPILRTVGYSAVMFVITGRSLGSESVKSSFHLSELELEKMVASGHWELGSHTRNGHGMETIGSNGQEGHFLSNELWLRDTNRLETPDEFRKRITADLVGAKNDIEKNLGVKSPFFAYPYGDWGQASGNFPQSEEILGEIVKSIYAIAFAQAGNNDYVSNPADNSYISRRIGVDSSVKAPQLVEIMNNALAKPINYLDDFSADRGWLRGWGMLKVENGEMFLGTTKTEDSASTFLSGSSLWKNYQVLVKVKIIQGSSFEILSHYNDQNNYTDCDFAGDEVILVQKVGGQDQPSIQAKLPQSITPGVIFDSAMKVEGQAVTCYLNGIPVVSGTFSGLDHGGIGFKTWDSTGSGSRVSFSGLKVSGN